jgi:glycolate oxidase FAD binding subunit
VNDPVNDPVNDTVLRPTDLRSARDAVLDTAGPIGIRGAGTAAGWAGELGPVDSVLDTTGLAGIVAHNPADLTVAVRAGTPLRALNEELAGHGQRVAFDAARVADGATVGGLVATADAGPTALVYGSMRDLVIGVTLVLADGTVARSGGHVIKNVAGFDLAKLMHGSYGAFGLLTEVVLRLHPIPERTATLAVDCPLADAGTLAATVLGGPHEPEALEWISSAGAGPGTLLVRIEGTAAALPARVDRLAAALRDSAPGPGERAVRALGPYESAVGADASGGEPDPWLRHADLVRGLVLDGDPGGGTQGGAGVAVLRIGVRPSRLPELIAALPARAVTAGLGTGVATVVLPADARAVAEAHAAVHAAGGTSVLRARPAGSDAPPWGPEPSAVAVLRALKRELDPDGRFGPGRFAPWITSPAPSGPVTSAR